MDKKICDYIDRQRENYIGDLERLVRINSVRTAQKPGMPFGEGGAKALGEAQNILQRHGFDSTNLENYALEATVGSAPQLMLLAHLDVVPPGDGWTFNPFSLTIKGDNAYGRGVTDDKGAALACIYAMKAVYALYGEPESGVRLVLGSGEETGSEDMDYYFSKRKKLKYTLSPDADYPLINIEKGRYAPKYVKASAPDNIAEIIGGDTQNIVPAKAHALVTGVGAAHLENSINAAAKKTGAAFTYNHEPNGIRIMCTGRGAHAATPQKGNNAQTALIELLIMLFPQSKTVEDLKGLIKLFPHNETNGSSAGVKMSDEISGELTLNFGLLSYKNGKMQIGLDMRTPVCAEKSSFKSIIDEKIAELGFCADGQNTVREAHCVPESSALIKELLSVYEDYTGEKGSCLSIGGGTYVHGIEGGVAFGVEFPGKDYRIHGADEYCSISEMLLTAKMYAQIIKDLCY